MRRIAAVLLVLGIVTALGLWAPPPAVRGQAVDVYINVTGGDRSRKLNIAVPEFTVVAGTEGCTTITSSDLSSDATGTKSRINLYGLLGASVSVVVCVAETISSV